MWIIALEKCLFKSIDTNEALISDSYVKQECFHTSGKLMYIRCPYMQTVTLVIAYTLMTVYPRLTHSFFPTQVYVMHVGIDYYFVKN